MVSREAKSFDLRIKHIPYLRVLNSLCKKRGLEVFLVGGALRDIFLRRGKIITDFDFAVNKSTRNLAGDFAREVKSKVIVLDDFFKSYRVVVKKRGISFHYDFTGFKGKDLEEDLLKRDFTINTLCISIRDILRKQSHLYLKDYLGALRDIHKKIIRVNSLEVLKEDPLRILRAFSLSAILGLKIEERTLAFIKRIKSSLREVSVERLREELFKILSAEDSYKYIYLLDELRIIDVLFPQVKKARNLGKGGYHHLNVWPHSLSALRSLELLYRRRLKKDKKIKIYLDEEIASLHTRFQLLKLGCLLHDIGKPQAYKRKNKRTIFYGHENIGAKIVEGICDRYHMSGKEKEFLRRVVSLHMRPGFMIKDKFPTPRAIYRFCRDAKEESLSILFLFIADLRSTKGEWVDVKDKARKERITLKLIRSLLEDKKEKKRKKLIDGYKVMQILKIVPSPLVGEILSRIEELQALGEVKTKLQAQRKVKEIYEALKKGRS